MLNVWAHSLTVLRPPLSGDPGLLQVDPLDTADGTGSSRRNFPFTKVGSPPPIAEFQNRATASVEVNFSRTPKEESMVDQRKDKVALVSGAGSSGPGWGNGKATAVLFAREGAKVLAADINRDAALET